MNRNKKQLHLIGEIIFQLMLLLVIFMFYSMRKVKGAGIILEIDSGSIAIYLFYALVTFFISYFLLPKLLYRKRYTLFFTSFLALIGLVILTEELVLEQIFYPDSRGKKFPGILFSLLDTIPTITALVGFKFAWDAITKQRELEKLQYAVQESELQFLKSQINPHFLFNNLNNLYSYALDNSPKTPQLILELSGVLRYILYECKEKYVLLGKEIEQLKSFIHLNELQIEGRGVVKFTHKNISNDFKIAPLILSVFVENAFKHSSSSQEDGIQIIIGCAMRSNGVFEMICENTYDQKTNTDGLKEGIGLDNVEKRLELLYPNQYELDVSSDREWYRVRLSINLKDN